MYFCSDPEFSNHREDIDDQFDCNHVLLNSQADIKHKIVEVLNQEITFEKNAYLIGNTYHIKELWAKYAQSFSVHIDNITHLDLNKFILTLPSLEINSKVYDITRIVFEYESETRLCGIGLQVSPPCF